MKSFVTTGLVFVLLQLISFSSSVQAQNSIPKIEFEKYTLPNGLEVVIHIDRKLPIVHVNQWFYVGSANEKKGRSGFAHLFEHMMFQGSKNANKDYIEYVESAGADVLGGGVNGTTSQDRTNYFVTVPSGNLEFILWLESDRLATLGDAFTKESLDNQRNVVKNERREGLENQPYGRWYNLIVENLYPYGHPYQHSVIGSHEDLTAASEEDVREFFQKYYTPNNLSLVISGDIDIPKTKNLVKKYFGTIPSRLLPARPAKGTPKLENEKIIEVKEKVSQARTYFAWNTPAFFDKGDADLELAALILTSGLSARLNKVLLYDKQLATNISAAQNGQALTGWFRLTVTARQGIELKQIENIIDSEIARLAKEGPTEDELKRAKTKWESRFVNNLENIGGFGGKSDLLNRYNTFLGDPGKFDKDIERHRQVSIESIKIAVDRYLNTKKRVLVRFYPTKTGLPAKVALDRTKQPSLGKDKEFNAPEIKKAKLANGIDIFVVSKPELPKVTVQLASKAGSITDSDAKSGLALLTHRTMRRGTNSLKALQIDEELGNLGTRFFGGVDKELSDIGVEVLKKNLNSSIKILADVVINPAFYENEFDREKKQTIASLKRASNNPNTIANKVAFKLAFGSNHPYGRPTSGFLSTIKDITRKDVVDFHKTFWKPNSSALIFVGDITLTEAFELAEKYFGHWSGGSAPEVNIPTVKSENNGKIYLINRQGAAQTVVSHILSAPQRRSEDHYSLSLTNSVYGEGINTRLNKNLREDKGYSYGVFATTHQFSKNGVWIASGGIQTDKTKESVVEFIRELKNIAGEKPISAKELEAARVGKIRSYAQQFESYRQVADLISSLWLHDLSMTNLQMETKELATISLETVNSVAAKYANPNKSALLLVGDISKFENKIRELNLGEVIVLDVDGNPQEK